jgi:protein-tyrosine-phosphatase
VIRVLFVCSQNSARSQLAEATWRRASLTPALSAGLNPATAVHPLAVTIGRRHGLSLEKAQTRRFEHVARPTDLVVAVCDNTHEQLGRRASTRVHWSIPDPVRVGTEEAFETAFAEIERRVTNLAVSTQPSPER